MEEKSYNQMRQEFVSFYHNDVKIRLPKYTLMRKLQSPMQIAFWTACCSFIFLFLYFMPNNPVEILLKQIITKSFLENYLSLFSMDIIVKMFLGIDIFIYVLSVLILILLSVVSAKNKVGITGTIQQDLEMELKEDLMPKFVNIFFENGVWYKNSSYYHQNEIQNLEEYQEYISSTINEQKKYKIHNLRKLKLLNPYPWARYDDIVFGTFKDVNIRIFEANTKILRFPEFMVLAFLFIWLTGFTAGVFLVLFLTVVLPVIILMLLIFSFKIFQYSLFKGLIVEFDMNKNFQGHTIIHEKSIIAKKIPIPSTYQEIKLETSDFSDKYKVYSDDQIEARYLLTPSMMERIENLKFTFKAKYVRASFKDNKLYIAIHTGKDMFAMGNDFKDSDSNTFQELYDEMISILKIVDELKLNQHIGL